MPVGVRAANLCGAVSPVAIYILAICFAGALVAGAAFAWAAMRGEFADAAQTAFQVFDDEDEAPTAPAGPTPQAPEHPS